MLESLSYLNKFYDSGEYYPYPISDTGIGQSLWRVEYKSGSVGFHTMPEYLKRINLGIMDRLFLNPGINIKEDLRFFVGFCLFVVVLRIFFGGLFWKGRLIYKSPLFYIAQHLPIKPKNQQRFSESFWFFVWHTSSFTWCILTLYMEAGTSENPNWPYMFFKEFSPRWFWLATSNELSDGIYGWPHLIAPHYTRMFYLSNMAFWFVNILLIFVEVAKKDFYIMIVHHFATFALISTSYVLSLWRFGLIVLFIHDMADIVLYGSKCLKYCSLSNTLTDLCFASFMVVFFFSRLVFYPLICVYPVVNIKILSEITCNFMQTYYDVPLTFFFPAFLSILCNYLTGLMLNNQPSHVPYYNLEGLHVYWFILILSMALRLVKVQLIEKSSVEDIDPRSDDEYLGELKEELTKGGKKKDE